MWVPLERIGSRQDLQTHTYGKKGRKQTKKKQYFDIMLKIPVRFSRCSLHIHCRMSCNFRRISVLFSPFISFYSHYIDAWEMSIPIAYWDWLKQAFYQFNLPQFNFFSEYFSFYETKETRENFKQNKNETQTFYLN